MQLSLALLHPHVRVEEAMGPREATRDDTVWEQEGEEKQVRTVPLEQPGGFSILSWHQVDASQELTMDLRNHTGTGAVRQSL